VFLTYCFKNPRAKEAFGKEKVPARATEDNVSRRLVRVAQQVLLTLNVYMYICIYVYIYVCIYVYMVHWTKAAGI